MDGTLFSSSLNHTGKTTRNKKFLSSKHYYNLMFPTYFCQLVAQVFLTKQMILFNSVEFFTLCRSLLNSAAFTKQKKITHGNRNSNEIPSQKVWIERWEARVWGRRASCPGIVSKNFEIKNLVIFKCHVD